MSLSAVGAIGAFFKWLIRREVNRIDALHATVASLPQDYVTRADHRQSTQALQQTLDGIRVERLEAHERVLDEIRESRRETRQDIAAVRGDLQQINRRVDHLHRQVP